MKRKILIVIYVFLTIVTLKLLYNSGVNSILLNKYNNGEYSEKIAKTLTYFNFPQSYIANYNYGNILYQNGEYENAIDEYKQALDRNIPKYKECNVRINYALSICKTVQINEMTQDNIKSAVKKYESAIDILTENGCANKKNNNGHSKMAEQLKKDIQNEIDRLKKMQESEYENSNENDEDENKKEENTIIERKIQEIKENATKEQREIESYYKNYNDDFDRVNKNW